DPEARIRRRQGRRYACWFPYCFWGRYSLGGAHAATAVCLENRGANRLSPWAWFFRRSRRKRVPCLLAAPKFHNGNARVVMKWPHAPADPVIRKLSPSIAVSFLTRPAIRICALD